MIYLFFIGNLMDLDLHYFMDSYTAIIEVCPILSFIGRKIKKVNAWMCDGEKVFFLLLENSMTYEKPLYIIKMNQRKKIVQLALPAMAENLLQMLMGVVDNYLVAQIGLVAVSGV